MLTCKPGFSTSAEYTYQNTSRFFIFVQTLNSQSEWKYINITNKILKGILVAVFSKCIKETGQNR